MPVYNEPNSLRAVVERVLAVPQELELICVDDGSRDESRDILSELAAQHSNIRVLLAAEEHGERRRSPGGYIGGHGRLRTHPGCRSGIRSGRLSQSARTPDPGQGRRGLRLTFSGR